MGSGLVTASGRSNRTAPNFTQLLILMGLVVVLGSAPSLAQDRMLPEFPDWVSGPTFFSRALAVADVDLDGDLDLVVGYTSSQYEPNSLYLNGPDGLAASPFAPPLPADYTYAVAFGDIDGDGYVDLVCGNRDHYRSTLYHNLGGSFGEEPAWRSDPALDDTRAVALGDLDGDGDLDLVCGNKGSGNVLYLNTAGELAGEPTWRGWPESRSRGGVAWPA